MTNEERAERAEQAVAAYVAAVGDNRDAFSDGELVADIVGDLAHWARSRGMALDAFKERASGGIECHEEEHEEEEAEAILCERCGEPGVEEYGGESLCVDCCMAAQDGTLYEEG